MPLPICRCEHQQMPASSVELLSPICHHSSQWRGNFAEMPDDSIQQLKSLFVFRMLAIILVLYVS